MLVDRGRGRQSARHRGRSRSPAWSSEFAEKGALKPLDVRDDDDRRQLPARVDDSSATSTASSTALVFKAANKSTRLVQRPGVRRTRASTRRRPGTDPHRTPKTLKASGVPAYSIGGADGWTLTDLFENIYLRTAGPDKYDQLCARTRSRGPTSRSRTRSRDGGQVFGDTDNIAGGTSGALQTDFPTSVTNVVRRPAEGARWSRGRLRRRRGPDVDAVEAGDGLRRVHVPVDQRLAADGRRDRRRPGRHVQRHAGDARRSSSTSRRPRRPRSGRSAAASRRRTRTSTRASTRTRSRGRRRPRSAAPTRSGSTCPTCSRPRSAAPPARASGSTSRTSSRTRATSTAQRQQLETAATKAYERQVAE